MRWDDDQVGAFFFRLPERLAGLYVKTLCKLVFCENDSVPLFRIAADGYWLFADFRMMQTLDRCVKGIKIAM